MALLTRARALSRGEKTLLAAAGGLLWTRLYDTRGKAIQLAVESLAAKAAPEKAVDRSWLGIAKAAASKFSADDAPRRGAALSYYTMFSIAPLILITMTIVGLVLGGEAAQSLVGGQVRAVLGADKAEMIEKMLQSAQSSGKAAAGVTGILTLLLGAGAVVTELQASLNHMWGAPDVRSGWGAFIKNKLFSMAFVMGVGFLLLVSLVVNSGVAAMGKWASSFLPLPSAVFYAVNLLASFAVITTLFAGMFKFLPRTKVAWGDVWLGAAVTAFLFAAGNFLLGLYLGKAGPQSTYGAAGSLLAVMLWAYYCAQILFYGAEFTRVYAERRGSGVPELP